MRLTKRFRHRDEAGESLCPRCGTPAPAGAVDCAACGWDLRETFRGVTGSHLSQEDMTREEAADQSSRS